MGSAFSVPLHFMYEGSLGIVSTGADKRETPMSKSCKKPSTDKSSPFSWWYHVFGKSSASSCATLLSILNGTSLPQGNALTEPNQPSHSHLKQVKQQKTTWKDELKINNEGVIGKYLGLPEHLGRKNDTFFRIVDMIKQQAHSWTSRYLSGAGKMILLKAVIETMPTYAMSCFKFPISLCQQIQYVLTRFWWDVKP